MIDYAAEVAASKARRALLVAADAEAIQRANVKYQAWLAIRSLATRKAKLKKFKELRRKERYRVKHQAEIKVRNKVDYQRRKLNGKLEKDKDWRQKNKRRMRQLQKNYRDAHREELRRRDRKRYARIQEGNGKTVKPYKA